jgi:hypothetical protein
MESVKLNDITFSESGLMIIRHTADSTKQNTEMFIDSTSTHMLFIILVVFLAFVIGQVLAGFRSPSLLSLETQSFEFSHITSATPVTVNTSLSLVRSYHRFLDLNCTLARPEGSPRKLHFLVGYSALLIFYTDQVQRDVVELPASTAPIAFEPGSNAFSFSVIHKEISSSDSVFVSLRLTSATVILSGCTLSWSVSNSPAIQYLQLAKLLLSSIIGCVLIIYVKSGNLEAHSFSQKFCLLLGIFGLLASNPLFLFLPESTASILSSEFVISAYIASFRLFCLLQLDMICGHRYAPRLFSLTFFALFFSCYLAVDFAASCQHSRLYPSTFVPGPPLAIDKALSVFRFLYAFTFIGLGIFAARSKKASARRIVVFLLLMVFDVAASDLALISRRWTEALNYSVVPVVLKFAPPMGAGAVVLLLLRKAVPRQYRKVEPGFAGDTGAALEVDALTDLEDEKVREEEDEDEIEEDEEEDVNGEGEEEEETSEA